MVDQLDAGSSSKSSSPKQTRKRSPLKIAAVVVVCIVILAVVLPVTNLFIQPATGTLVTQAANQHAEFRAAARILERDCMGCHCTGGDLPLYAALPGARSLIEEDQTVGRRYFDMMIEMVPEDGRPYGQAALAKLEYVVKHDTMPPTRYVVMHWNQRLTDAEQDTLLDAIHAVRRKHYAAPDVDARFADSALQPLPQSVTVNVEQAALGDKMYHDVRLSADDTLSCASCHGLDTGGVDRGAVSTGINGAKGPINAPTVFNAAYNLAQFWDGRAADLAEQAAGPVHNPLEMGSNWDQVLGKLRQDQEVVAAFEAAYPDGLIGDNIAHAIAEFEKTLITPNSRLDRYLRGDESALTGDEIEGLVLFQDNACVNCHVGPALGGQSYEVLGRGHDYFADRPAPIGGADQGRFNVTHDPVDRHRFKVPVLRNVALTYPYFHDGSQATLADAVQSMARYQAYREFTPQETDQVVAFLKTLTGEYRGAMLQ